MFTIYRIFEPNSELKLRKTRILGLACNIIYFTNYPHMHILKSTLCFDIPSKNNPFICLIAISDSIFFEKTVIVYPASKQNPKISKMKVSSFSVQFASICIFLSSFHRKDSESWSDYFTIMGSPLEQGHVLLSLANLYTVDALFPWVTRNFAYFCRLLSKWFLFEIKCA